MSLSNVIGKLIAASARDGAEHSTTLERGLIVQVQQHASKLTLRIARIGNTPPSLLEYQTCIRALPEHYKPITPIEPIGYLEHGSNILSASWQLPERLL